MISVGKDTFEGTGVADLESPPVVEIDCRDAPADESAEKFVSVGESGRSCVVVATSVEQSANFIADENLVCCSGKGRLGASGGIGKFVMGPK